MFQIFLLGIFFPQSLPTFIDRFLKVGKEMEAVGNQESWGKYFLGTIEVAFP